MVDFVKRSMKVNRRKVLKVAGYVKKSSLYLAYFLLLLWPFFFTNLIIDQYSSHLSIVRDSEQNSSPIIEKSIRRVRKVDQSSLNQSPLVQKSVFTNIAEKSPPIVKKPIVDKLITRKSTVVPIVKNKKNIGKPTVEKKIIKKPNAGESIVENPTIKKPNVKESIINKEKNVEKQIVEKPNAEKSTIKTPDVENSFVETLIDITSQKSVHKSSIIEKSVEKTTATSQKCPEKGSRIDCCCPQACSEFILDRAINVGTCRSRIRYLMNNYGNSQREACVTTANQHPYCTKCNPDKCPVPVE